MTTFVVKSLRASKRSEGGGQRADAQLALADLLSRTARVVRCSFWVTYTIFVEGNSSNLTLSPEGTLDAAAANRLIDLVAQAPETPPVTVNLAQLREATDEGLAVLLHGVIGMPRPIRVRGLAPRPPGTPRREESAATAPAGLFSTEPVRKGRS